MKWNFLSWDCVACDTAEQLNDSQGWWKAGPRGMEGQRVRSAYQHRKANMQQQALSDT